MNPEEKIKILETEKREQARKCLIHMSASDVQEYLKIDRRNRANYIGGDKTFSLKKAMVIIETCKENFGYEGID